MPAEKDMNKEVEGRGVILRRDRACPVSTTTTNEENIRVPTTMKMMIPINHEYSAIRNNQSKQTWFYKFVSLIGHQTNACQIQK